MSDIFNQTQAVNLVVGILALVIGCTVIVTIDRLWDDIRDVVMTIAAVLFFVGVALLMVGFVCWCLVLAAYLGAFILSVL